MISNEELIYNKLCELHPEARVSITKLSRNDSGERDFVISDEFGFNYDVVYNCSNAYRQHSKEKSPDALFLYDSKLYFIEFKEGGSNRQDIRLKIHEGVTTLYHFVKKHTPSIQRKDFVELNINYAVICRGNGGGNKNNVNFLDALDGSSKKYSLKNIEGFLVKKTAVIDEPSQMLSLLNRVTAGNVKDITVFEHQGVTKRFELTN